MPSRIPHPRYAFHLSPVGLGASIAGSVKRSAHADAGRWAGLRGRPSLFVSLVAVLVLSAPTAAAASGTAAVGWGHNVHSQLGAGFYDGMEAAPVTVSGLSDIRSMAAGWEDSFALLGDGTLRAWGSNMAGQLGDGTLSNTGTPTPVISQAGETLRGVSSVATDGDHSMALLANGSVETWGGSSDGSRGNGESGLVREAEQRHSEDPAAYPFANRWRAAEVQLPAHATEIAVAGRTDYATLEGDDRIVAWGGNAGGKLGIGVQPGDHRQYLPEACKLVADRFVETEPEGSLEEPVETEEVAGEEASCSTRPVEVHLPKGLKPGAITQIAGGYGAAYAVLANGHVLAWGNGASGALGNGGVQSSDVPVEVSTNAIPPCPSASAAAHCPVVSVSAGKDFAWALLADGEVAGWGANQYGQLGSADSETCKATECSTVPKSVIGKQYGAAEEISVGRNSAAWLSSAGDDTVGQNRFGLLGTGLGLGTTGEERRAAERRLSRTPQRVAGLGAVGGIASGEEQPGLLDEGNGPRLSSA